MVTHHQHVEMLFKRIHRVGTRWVCGGGDDIFLAAYPDDIGGMATTGTFGMKGVDHTVLDRADCVSTNPLSFRVSVWIIT